MILGRRHARKTLPKALIAREAVKLALRPLLRWSPLVEPEPGFSIVLGVPWHLKELLPVNLLFVSKTNLEGLARIHVVFDRRRREEMDRIEAEARAKFPELPLVFQHYPSLAGRIIEAANVSTFYNSMNCALALGRVTTGTAILHDFDLFPLNPDYFQAVVRRMREEDWRFCGLERTHFDGLTDEDDILGTWCLGIDVEWLRRTHRPVEIFHRLEKIRGRWVTLDPFSSIQRRTPRRGLVGEIGRGACCHVGNLCATWMRHQSGQRVRFTWKMHYLWYLEALNGRDRLDEIREKMDSTDDGILALEDFEGDFRNVDPTCANVLRVELRRMESFLHDRPRERILRFVDSFQAFLERAGSASGERVVA